MKYHIRDEHERETAMADLRAAALPASMQLTDARARTLSQNAALHLWLEWVAQTLNDAGFDMQATLRPGAQIPWTAHSVKEHLWRPVQEAMLDKRSTADANRVDYSKVEQALSAHLASRLGVTCPPWPQRENA